MSDIIVHSIESAIAKHYDTCKRSHTHVGAGGRTDGNGGWFHCEAKTISKYSAIAALEDLVAAAERWRIEMRMATPGPCDQRLIAAVEGYRDVINAAVARAMGGHDG